MSLGRKRKNEGAVKSVNPDLIAKAVAKAVFTGNIVDFRFLFLPFSPAREESSEDFDMPRYAYLLPDAQTEKDAEFQSVLALVRSASVWPHIHQELHANRPAQLPSELLVRLGDNAVRAGKYTTAAQAYELLRIRPRMQEEFYAAADRALDENDIPHAVRGYMAATGLEYDYAAFPEPLPQVADFQKRALMVHADFPQRPEDCLALQPDDQFVRSALTYLLANVQAAARLESRPLEMRRAFLRELVYRRDPGWDEFAGRWREAVDMFRRIQEAKARYVRETDAQAAGRGSATLAAEIQAELGEDPRKIPAHLLGREIPQGEWWQYLKEMAYEHPAAALFVCRYILSNEEILVPVYRQDSPIPAELGLRLS